jgi:MFS family permease
MADPPPASLRDLRPLFVPIYVSAFAAVVAMSFYVAFLPLHAKDHLHAKSATVGAILGMQGLGPSLRSKHQFGRCVCSLACGAHCLAGSIAISSCAGVFVAKVGERRGMIAGAAARVVAYGVLVLSSLFDSAWAVQLLFVGVFGEGVGMGTFQVARNSFMSAAVDKSLRGRANALIGALTRAPSSTPCLT